MRADARMGKPFREGRTRAYLEMIEMGSGWVLTVFIFDGKVLRATMRQEEL